MSLLFTGVSRLGLRANRQRTAVATSATSSSLSSSRHHIGGVTKPTKFKTWTTRPTFSIRGYSSAGQFSEQEASMVTAAWQGDLEAVKAAIEKGVNVNGSDYDGRTALHLACAGGHMELVKFLVKSGAKVNIKDRWHNTPLQDALLGKHDSLIKHLRTMGGSISSARAEEMPSLFCGAANEGNIEEMNRLVETGAEVDKGDYDMRTPLHLAVSEGHEQAVKWLLDHGASPQVVDRFGFTPLMVAQQKENSNLATLLTQHGADASAYDVYAFRHTAEFRTTLELSLPLIAERAGFDYIEVWGPTADGSQLKLFQECAYSPAYQTNIQEFRSTQDSFKVKKGEGLLGSAWTLSKPKAFKTMKDAKLGSRGKTIEAIGMNSGVMIPVKDQGDAYLVLACFTELDTCATDKKLAADWPRFSVFLNGLISAGVFREGEPEFSPLANRFEYNIPSNQMASVFRHIVQQGVFSPSTVYAEVDQFYNLDIQPYYFERFSDVTIARHIHAFIAARKLAQATGDYDSIKLEHQNVEEGSAFYMIPYERSAIEKVEKELERLIGKLPEGVSYTLTCLSDEEMHMPGSSQRLCMYIFDSGDYVNPNPKKGEAELTQLCSKRFLKEKPEEIQAKYAAIVDRTGKKLAPIIEQYADHHPEDGTIPIMFGFKKTVRSSRYFATITECLHSSGIKVSRKFIETFSNDVVAYSFYLDRGTPKEKVQDVLTMISLMHLIPNSALTGAFFNGDLSIQEYAYVSSAGRVIFYFLNKRSEEFNLIAESLKHDPVALGRLSLLQQRLKAEAVSQGMIFGTCMEYKEITSKIYNNFKKKNASDSEEISKLIREEVDSPFQRSVLEALLLFNDCVQKHNFFTYRKAAICYRLGGNMCEGTYDPKPYGFFFVMASDFQGFHIRFEDVARGGIRIIRSNSGQVYNHNLTTLFAENYGLAYTQNKKNKDIPEFGSKGTILLRYDAKQKGPVDTFPPFQKYVSGLLDVCIPEHPGIVDNSGKQEDEILFLGPDEGTADYMEWASRYSQRRAYKYWRAFTTGKPATMGGIPHDVYGMTTRSVRKYVEGCLEKLGLKQEETTKLQTGGPDGDLGSNEILMSSEKTIGIVDGSGVLYDPQGIDRTELTRLAKERKMGNSFDMSKIGEGGFFVGLEDRNVTLPNGDTVASGVEFRNTFHLNPLAQADVFVPCGGRPGSVTLHNVGQLINKNGTPRFKVVVEGANLFLTQDARMVLEEAGVVVYKDASANKGGVTASSHEVLAALAIPEDLFETHMCANKDGKTPEFYDKYVKEVCTAIESNARGEFDCIWKEKERSGEPHYLITDTLSDRINNLANSIYAAESLWKNEELKKSVLSKAIPKSLQDLITLEKVMERVPPAYLRTIFSTYIASNYVYKFGISAPEIDFFTFLHDLQHK